ncbi:hypothetical protein PO909_010355 [Leuciscus waleckii]
MNRLTLFWNVVGGFENVLPSVGFFSMGNVVICIFMYTPPVRVYVYEQKRRVRMLHVTTSLASAAQQEILTASPPSCFEKEHQGKARPILMPAAIARVPSVVVDASSGPSGQSECSCLRRRNMIVFFTLLLLSLSK